MTKEGESRDTLCSCVCMCVMSAIEIISFVSDTPAMIRSLNIVRREVLKEKI